KSEKNHPSSEGEARSLASVAPHTATTRVLSLTSGTVWDTKLTISFLADLGSLKCPPNVAGNPARNLLRRAWLEDICAEEIQDTEILFHYSERTLQNLSFLLFCPH